MLTPDSPHYFASGADGELDASSVTWRNVTLAGQKWRVATAPGVFSAARVDLGTQVLLRTVAGSGLDLPAGYRLLDLGCGWGPLALVMAKAAPSAEVWAVDVNRVALQLVALTAQAAGLDNLRVATPDQAAELRPNVIWSNPPIRIGKAALHNLLTTWLGRLEPGGWADLVVQRHLGADSLLAWLNHQGWPTSKLASAKGYRVLRVLSAADPLHSPTRTPLPNPLPNPLHSPTRTPPPSPRD